MLRHPVQIRLGVLGNPTVLVPGVPCVVVIVDLACVSAVVIRIFLRWLDFSDEIPTGKFLVRIASHCLDFYFMISPLATFFLGEFHRLVPADIHPIGISLSEYWITESEIIAGPKLLFQVAGELIIHIEPVHLRDIQNVFLNLPPRRLRFVQLDPVEIGLFTWVHHPDQSLVYQREIMILNRDSLC